MCGRFTLTWDPWRRVAERLGLAADVEASYRPCSNSTPTGKHFILTSKFERPVFNRDASAG